MINIYNKEVQMSKHASEDPPYVPETKDFLRLRAYVTPDLLKNGGQAGHLTMAFETLGHTLHAMYKETSISKLVERSTQIGENTLFSEAMTGVLQKSKWAKGTIYTVTAALRKILRETATSESFIGSIKMIQPLKELHPIFGNIYTKLDKDDPVRALLDNWILVLKTNTRNRSDLGLRNMFAFYLNTVLPGLGLSLNTWPDDGGKSIATKINNPEIVRKMCGTSGNANRKLQWLRVFCTYLAPCDVAIPGQTFADHHRISVGDLERLYTHASTTPLHALMYMILMTTGMRVGGLAQIKIEHVMTNDVEIKPSGRTIEKGKKWFTFMMNEQVQKLMYDWIVNHRPADPSPYVFPGQCASRGHMTTATIRNIFQGWCKAAGLTGKAFHPHALRHILLESGNTVGVNHSSTKAAEQFDLKENASEVAERASIPWLVKANRQKRVPCFPVQPAAPTDDIRQKKKRRKDMLRDPTSH
jgi:integrase